MTEDRTAIALELAEWIVDDPCGAHEVIFKHRHDSDTPDFHKELIELFHSTAPNVMALAFRGSGKSSLCEETIILLAASGLIHNALIIGDSWLRACDRLRAIKRELETNEYLEALYGSQAGETWAESRLVLSNGVAITAHGQGQALRGVKHHQYRPDLCFVDDLESEETVATKEARRKLSDWYWKDLMPALAPNCRVLVAATPLDPEALAVTLSKMPEFKTVTVPALYKDGDGVTRSSWPSRFPVEALEERRKTYVSAGKNHVWTSEYMVQAVDPATRLFTKDMFRFDPSLQRTWEPTYVVYDPARTINVTSATTGVVCASWVGRRIIVWDAIGPRWTPSQIIDDIFDRERKWDPIKIAVEKDGLEDFLMEPLRTEQVRRGALLPIEAVKAPKGKLQFIQRLQPLFVAGDIVFAGTEEKFADVVEQFLSYPTGTIDVPNAMAYLLEMRQGLPVYDDASERHVLDQTTIRQGPLILAVNAGPFGSTAVLLQYKALVMTILGAWAAEGDPGQSIPSMIEEARLFAGRSATVVAPPAHFEVRDQMGLRASLRGVSELRKGGDPVKGRELLRTLLRSEAQGCPRFLIGPEAVWARRAIFGGYAREDGRTEPRPSLYATMMQGVESAMAGSIGQAPSSNQPMATTPDGRQYQTAEVRRR